MFTFELTDPGRAIKVVCPVCLGDKSRGRSLTERVNMWSYLFLPGDLTDNEFVAKLNELAQTGVHQGDLASRGFIQVPNLRYAPATRWDVPCETHKDSARTAVSLPLAPCVRQIIRGGLRWWITAGEHDWLAIGATVREAVEDERQLYLNGKVRRDECRTRLRELVGHASRNSWCRPGDLDNLTNEERDEVLEARKVLNEWDRREPLYVKQMKRAEAVRAENGQWRIRN